MKIGITGARGFIGSHIAKSLRVIKGVKVFSYDLPESNLLDVTALSRFVKGKDVIIHAGAVNRGTDTDVIAGTVVATYNLISVIGKLKHKPKIIFLSSVQAETETLYGISKKLAETMLADFAKTCDVQVSIFRVANVFGEGCRPFYNSVVATFCYQLARGESVEVNPSSKRFNFVYVNDLVSEIVKNATSSKKTPFYFKRVISKNELTISELAASLKRIAASKGKGLKSKLEKDLYRTYLSHKESK